MSALFINIKTPEDENYIANLIIEAIGEYLKEHDLDIQYMSDIKLQKLVFRVADMLDLPLTRSWYMRGCYVHNSIINRDFLKRIVESGYKKEKGEEYKILYDAVSKNIEGVWWTPTDRFLEDLYKTQAPEAYRNIYISNNDILNLNKEAINFLRDFAGKRTLAKWIALSTDYYQRISKNVSKLHIELISKKEFRDFIIPFFNFTDLLEMLYLKIDDILKSEVDISSDVLEFFELVDRVYFNNIWQYPALVISKETVIGIRKDEVIEENLRRLERAEDRINYYMEHIKKGVSELDLLPSIKDLETKYKDSVKTLGEDVSKKIADFWKVCSKA